MQSNIGPLHMAKHPPKTSPVDFKTKLYSVLRRSFLKINPSFSTKNWKSSTFKNILSTFCRQKLPTLIFYKVFLFEMEGHPRKYVGLRDKNRVFYNKMGFNLKNWRSSWYRSVVDFKHIFIYSLQGSWRKIQFFYGPSPRKEKDFKGILKPKLCIFR